MNTYRVDIFHVADDNAVISLIAHYFIFDFFPAGNGPFDEDLIDRAEFNTARSNHKQFVIVVGNTTAGAA